MAHTDRKLSERKCNVLRAVVEAYIRTGDPVASKSLQAQFDFSAATLRNEMAELTELGYLEQPHTSAGRVPSEKGYRFYVDSLMESYALTSGELSELNGLVKNKAAELDGILDRAGKVMSALTNYPALAVRPGHVADGAARYKITRFDETSFLLIAIRTPEDIKSRLIQTGAPVSDGALHTLEEVLNRCIAGLSVQSVNVPLLCAMEAQMGSESHLIGLCVKEIYNMLGGQPDGAFRLDGMTRLLEYPEYADTAPLRAMLGALDDKEHILDLVSRSGGDQTHVYIGSENPLDSSHQSALILRTITAGDRVVGALGVIGPCRMDYSKVITAVEYLSENIRGLFGGQNPPELGTGEEPKKQ